MSGRSPSRVAFVALTACLLFALAASPSDAETEASSPEAVADVIADHFDGQVSQAAPAATTATSEALLIDSVGDQESDGLEVPIDVDDPIQFPGEDLSVTLEAPEANPRRAGS